MVMPLPVSREPYLLFHPDMGACSRRLPVASLGVRDAHAAHHEENDTMALVDRFQHPTYLVRKKIFKIFGDAFQLSLRNTPPSELPLGGAT